MTIRGLISDARHLTSILRPSGIAPFRHPERSKMPFVREVVFRKLGTEPKDLGEAATFIPNSSFLIPNLCEAFIPDQRAVRPKG